MSLLGPVYVFLNLTPRESAALIDSSVALQGIEGALHGLLALLQASGGLTPEQEVQVAAMAADLKASGDPLKAATEANQ